ncbi:hypothetical protein B0H12DRAFT_387530 [Mycena haematopus]|nr:hypothetical protein B0H12DRAFT_387530 [Mycena haematopus]
MNTFFERLPRFTGLKRFEAAQIRFTQTGITNLCGLPGLTHVGIFGCSVAPREHIDPVVGTLRVTSFVKAAEESMNDIWISLLSRDTLRELDFSEARALARSEVRPFPNVQTLEIDNFPPIVPDTVALFDKFPNLRTFRNRGYEGVLRHLTPMQASSIFPVLKEYIGAYHNLHIFVPRPTLTHITLTSVGVPFHHIVIELQGITTLPNITSLTALFTTSSLAPFGEMEVEFLFTLFPNLTKLQLTLMSGVGGDVGFISQATSFLKMLASNPLLPSTLQSLSLEWEGPDFDPVEPGPVDVPDFAVLRAELMTKCPTLAYIFFDGYHFLFWWWKTPWAWEATAHSYNDAEVLRARKTEQSMLTS